MELASGGVNGASALLGPGAFVWSGGDLLGSMSIAANANLSLSGSAEKRLNGVVLNQAGSAVWTGSGNLTGLNGAVLTNSGLFDIRTDAAMPNGSGTRPSFYNFGTVLKSAGSGTNLCDFHFSNSGTVDLRNGVLALGGGYTPSSTSQLKLVISGPAPGTQFSQLNLLGSATLGGTLSVAFVNGFSPTNGNSFALVNYGSLVSKFATEHLPTLPDKQIAKLNYGAAALTLLIQPGQTALNLVFTKGQTFDTFQFDIVGPPAESAIVLASPDPAAPTETWTGVFTNTPFSGNYHFTDSSPPLPPGFGRYYLVLFENVAPGLGAVGLLSR